MLAIFCEECGGKNIINRETLDQLDDFSIDCQICHSHISKETIISYSGSGHAVDTKNIRLLFIDDDPLFLELVHNAIKDEYKVDSALSGDEGLQLADQLEPNLIFLDINMPGTDGYEVCSQLKNNHKLRHIPVIFISAGTTSDDQWKGFNLGAVDYINKPIEPQILHARVAMHIRLQNILSEHKKEVEKSEEIITSMKQNTLQLEVEQERSRLGLMALRNGLNEVNQLVMLSTPDGKIKWANKKTIETFGLSLEAITNQPCSTFFCDSEEDCQPCTLSRLNSNNSCQTIEQFSSKLQTRVTHKLIPVFNEEGKLLSQIHLAELH